GFRSPQQSQKDKNPRHDADYVYDCNCFSLQHGSGSAASHVRIALRMPRQSRQTTLGREERSSPAAHGYRQRVEFSYGPTRQISARTRRITESHGLATHGRLRTVPMGDRPDFLRAQPWSARRRKLDYFAAALTRIMSPEDP